MYCTDNYDDRLSRPYDHPDESGLIGECAICGRDIYEDEPHYLIDTELVCDRSECLRDYVDSLGWYVYGRS